MGWGFFPSQAVENSLQPSQADDCERTTMDSVRRARRASPVIIFAAQVGSNGSGAVTS